MATLRQRSDRWQAIIKRRGYPPQTKTFDLRKDAEKWARQQERLMDSGQWQDRTDAEQTTLKDLLESYATEVSKAKRGADVEAYRLEMFKRSKLAQYSPAAITSKLVAEWRDGRLKEVSPGTVLRELRLLGHVFTVAIREWGIALNCNPVGLIRKPADNKARDSVLTDTQREALIAACGQCRNPWIRPVVVFALETAARRGEILSLTWGNVSLEKRTALVSGKTGARKVPPIAGLRGSPQKPPPQP